MLQPSEEFWKHLGIESYRECFVVAFPAFSSPYLEVVPQFPSEDQTASASSLHGVTWATSPPHPITKIKMWAHVWGMASHSNSSSWPWRLGQRLIDELPWAGESLWSIEEWSPKMSTSQFPKLVTITLCVKRDFAGLIKLRISPWGDYFRLSGWAQCNYDSLCEREARKFGSECMNLVVQIHTHTHIATYIRNKFIYYIWENSISYIYINCIYRETNVCKLYINNYHKLYM